MLNFNLPIDEAALCPLDEAERAYMEQLVPPEHFLRQLLGAVDFRRFVSPLALGYSPTGRRPLDPIVLLKLEILARRYRLSDRAVIEAARFNIAYRLFLGLSLKSPLPHHTSMTHFRQRIGPELMEEVFDELVGQARRLGLVKDRLRLKDATHVIANIAIPTAIGLVSQTRELLLGALEPFAADRVAEEDARAEAIRTSTADLKDEERLLQRVTHLRSVVGWADGIPGRADFAGHAAKARERLISALEVAHKVLADRDDPDGKDRIRSAHDPDARRGKHGGYFDGYQVDISMDADSGIITAMNVLPGNGDEGADVVDLLEREERAHGNDVAAVSADGAVYRGEVLRALTDPDGLNLEVFVPPTEPPAAKQFPPERFSLEVIDGKPGVRCPGGQATTTRERNAHATGYKYRFRESHCSGCSLRGECLSKADGKARQVMKNDYEAEYRAAKAKAMTAGYEKVRREHPAIERKLGELVRHQGLRYARYRGRLKVLYQSLATGLVVNMKRIVRLLKTPGTAIVGAVRAEVATGGWA